MPTVLIVEDSIDIAEVVRIALHFSGFIAAHAATTDIALTTVRRMRPDFILLDYLVPGTLGSSDFIAKLKAENIPSKVILMTGIGDPAQKAIQLGVTDAIQKPLDPSELITIINKRL